MEFGQLMIDILVYVSCKFQMYIFKTAQVISENVRIAFLYVLSINQSFIPQRKPRDHILTQFTVSHYNLGTCIHVFPFIGYYGRYLF